MIRTLGRLYIGKEKEKEKGKEKGKKKVKIKVASRCLEHQGNIYIQNY